MSTEPIDPIPQDLRGVYMDFPGIIILVILSLASTYLSLAYMKEGDTLNIMRIVILALFGWTALFWAANIFTGKPRFDFFFSAQDAALLFRYTVIALAGMMVLATSARLLSDKLTMAASIGVMSTSAGATMFFGISAAINEEWAMANLQRFLSFGLKSELWTAIGYVVRGLVFWGMHRPLAYTHAPAAWQFTLFASGCWLGYILASTKRFTIVILAHMTWNILAVI